MQRGERGRAAGLGLRVAVLRSTREMRRPRLGWEASCQLGGGAVPRDPHGGPAAPQQSSAATRGFKVGCDDVTRETEHAVVTRTMIQQASFLLFHRKCPLGSARYTTPWKPNEKITEKCATDPVTQKDDDAPYVSWGTALSFPVGMTAKLGPVLKGLPVCCLVASQGKGTSGGVTTSCSLEVLNPESSNLSVSPELWLGSWAASAQ